MRKFKKLYLHVGLEKTGTTSIQRYRNLLQNSDIISDFMNKADLVAPDTFEIEHRNPSLGGNLLWAKLMANNSNALFLPYGDMTRLMLKRPSFTRPFYFPNERANALRAVSSYNRVFEKILGPVPLKSWEDGVVLPDKAALNEDIDFIKNVYPHYDLSRIGLDSLTGQDWF